MRHRVFGKKLNRDIKERKALFKNLVLALVSHGKIQTSVAKAKAIQRLVEKMVTKAKSTSSASISSVSSFLGRKKTVDQLVKNVIPRFKDKVGGYLRMRRIGKRRGDSTEEAILEWSVKEEKKPIEKPGTLKVQKKENVQKTKQKKEK